MFQMSNSWWEFLLRDVVVFGFLLVLLRTGGKRQIGQLSPFDFVLILVVSNALQNSLNGGDNSLVGGMISALGLVLLNRLMAWMSSRSKRAERFLEGVPQVLVHNGRIYHAVLRKENMAQEELDAALREAGAFDVQDVHFAVLETNGHITVHLRKV